MSVINRISGVISKIRNKITPNKVSTMVSSEVARNQSFAKSSYYDFMTNGTSAELYDANSDIVQDFGDYFIDSIAQDENEEQTSVLDVFA